MKEDAHTETFPVMLTHQEQVVREEPNGRLTSRRTRTSVPERLTCVTVMSSVSAMKHQNSLLIKDVSSENGREKRHDKNDQSMCNSVRVTLK